MKVQGMIPGNITTLASLARLSVRGHAAMGRLPQGLGDLSALTELRCEKVSSLPLTGPRFSDDGLSSMSMQVFLRLSCKAGTRMGSQS